LTKRPISYFDSVVGRVECYKGFFKGVFEGIRERNNISQAYTAVIKENAVSYGQEEGDIEDEILKVFSRQVSRAMSMGEAEEIASGLA